jgi:hypothetical protein
MVSLREDLTGTNPPPSGSGIERTGMLDAFAHDTRDDVLVLAMFETRAWDLGDRQLWQLQEKLNAYVSFILDGELKDNFPHLAGKPVRIELRAVHEPSERAMGFLGRARDQLALQEIGLEVVLIGEISEGCCGGSVSGGCCGGSGQGDHGHDADHNNATGGCCGGARPEASGQQGCGCSH